jgi:signal transduction histidine kinase
VSAAPEPAAPAAEAPTLTALREARASRAEFRRRLLPLYSAALVLVIYIAARKPPYLGLHGASLGFSLALCGLVAGIAGVRRTLLIRRTPARVYVPLLAVLLGSSGVLVWLQPEGPGVIGFIGALLIVLSARVIPGRAGVTLLIAGCVAVLLTVALTGEHADQSRWVSVAVNVLPVLVPFVAVSLYARIRQQQERTENLLLELEETRGAELRAAALTERQRLARDMHDVLAHTLSGLTVQLEGTRLLAVSSGDERLASAIDRAHELAKSGLAEARQAIGMLRGDDLPGPERLAALATEFAADTGVPCQFTSGGEPPELRAEVKLALYRVTQEALTNVRKHAHPDRVRVSLSYEDDQVCLAVRDFGAGVFAVPSLACGGYGLTGMRERAELLGGTLVAGPADGGFLVELRVPA